MDHDNIHDGYDNEPGGGPVVDKGQLYQMSLLTLGGFSLLGAVLIYFFVEASFAELLQTGRAFWTQTVWGASFGLWASLLAIALIRFTRLRSVRDFYARMFMGLKLNFADIAFYSMCAGVGEEILFRAALQTMACGFFVALGWPIDMGVWLVSLVFVALHGYLNPRDPKMFLYGAFLVFVSAGMGYLFLYTGLLAAVLSHFVFDLIMFSYLIYRTT